MNKPLILLQSISSQSSKFFLFILILVIFYFVIRELNLWYWKINERLKAQNTTNKLLEENNKLLKDLIVNKSNNKDASILKSDSVADLNDPRVMDSLLSRLNKDKKAD